MPLDELAPQGGDILTSSFTAARPQRIGFAAPMLMIGCFILAALSNMAAQQTLQIASVGCLAAAAGWLMFTRRVQRMPLSAYELLLISCCVVSAFVSSWLALYSSSIYSFVLLACVVSAGLLVRGMALQQMFSVFVAAAVLLTMIPLFLQTRELAAALALTVSSIGLERFTPFNMHPNLAGFVYGGLAIILWFRASLARGWPGKLLFVGLAGLSALYVMAASARAALLGTAVVGVVYFGALMSSPAVRRSTKIGVLVALAFAGLVLLTHGGVLGYLGGVLEVDSDTRGVSSGASGRAEIWAQGIELLTSQPVRMLLGYGFRSSEPEVIGFPVESSYISLALEIGLIASAMLVGLYLLSAIRMVAIGRSGRFGKDGTIYLCFGLMVVFFLMHSIFNRYLLGIGNPMSLMGLLAMASFNSSFPLRRQQQLHAPAGSPWPAHTPASSR